MHGRYAVMEYATHELNQPSQSLEDLSRFPILSIWLLNCSDREGIFLSSLDGNVLKRCHATKHFILELYIKYLYELSIQLKLSIDLFV